MTKTSCTDDLVVTTCPDHGVKCATDAASHAAFVAMALEHRDAGDHDDAPFECWVCCPRMVIDPAGLVDEATS